MSDFDLEIGFLTAILKSEDPLILEGINVEAKDFDKKKNKEIFQFIKDYAEKVGALPKIEALNTIDDTVEFSTYNFDLKYLIDEFLARKLFRQVNNQQVEVDKYLRENDPVAAVESIQKFSENISIKRSVEVKDIYDYKDAAIERYRQLMLGKMGVTTPFPTLNRITMGLWPGTVTYFVGRPGTGKTQLLITFMEHFVESQKKCLVISPEMSKVLLAQRFFLLQGKVSAIKALRGEISTTQINRLDEMLTKLSEKYRGYIKIVDNIEDDLSLINIENVLDKFKPDIILVDSIYSLKIRGNKTERTMKAVDWFGRISKKQEVPIVAIHQLSREAVKQKKSGGVGFTSTAIALTDQLLWDAEAIYILEQSKEMKSDNEMKIHCGKVRDGYWDGKPIELHWDFDNMIFKEKGEEGKDFNDDEYVPNYGEDDEEFDNEEDVPF